MALMPTLATHLFTHSQPLLLSHHTEAFHWLTADDPGAGEVDEEDEDDEDDEDEVAEKDEEDEDEEGDTDEEDDDDLEDEEETLIVRR